MIIYISIDWTKTHEFKLWYIYIFYWHWALGAVVIEGTGKGLKIYTHSEFVPVFYF